MTKYELLLTLPGTLDENEAKLELEKVLVVIKTFVESPIVNQLGKIRLAYPIKQIRYGYFYTVLFETEPTNVPQINQKLILNKIPLRMIINKYNEKAKDIKITAVSQPTGAVVRMETKEKVSLSDIVDNKPEQKTPDFAPAATGSAITAPTAPASVAKEKIALEDIDKKLDEILSNTIVVDDV